jgi:hypothetical protein
MGYTAAMKKLTEFISTHREQFESTHNNIFAFSWSKITRRLAFLDIIEARYLEASAEFIANSEAARDLVKPGTHPVGPELAALHEAAISIGAEVHLQIESYYLFAKIVLDDVARAIEYYFGAVRRLPLDSHDDLASNLEGYAAAKDLLLGPELVAAIVDLKRRVSDVRDYKISHEKSPRTVSGTSWSGTGGARIMMTRLYPRTSDPEQFETELLTDLRQLLHDYLGLVIDFIVANEERTALKLEKK